jgi:hypothetical protein
MLGKRSDRKETHTVVAVLANLAQRIREEFEETPGLRITVSEASRFWGIDELACEQVFARLLATGFLARGVDDRYRQVQGQPVRRRL